MKALQNVTSPFPYFKGLREDNLSRVSSPLSCQIRKRRDEFTRKRSSKLNQDHQDSSWDTSPFLSLSLYHIWSLSIILSPWVYFQGSCTNYEYICAKKNLPLCMLVVWVWFLDSVCPSQIVKLVSDETQVEKQGKGDTFSQ